MGAIPHEFVCPISHEIMEHPVTLVETASVFDKQSIEEWLGRGNMSCPLTGLPVTSTALVVNRPLQQAIERWCLENPGCKSRVGGVVGSSVEGPSEEGASWGDVFWGCFTGRRGKRKKRKEKGVEAGLDGMKNAMSLKAATQLSRAVRRGDRDVVRGMVSQGVDVNVWDEAGRSSLHWAVIYGDVEIMSVLVYYNAQINFNARDSCAPLHFAAQFNQLEAARFLIAKGADVNAVSVHGYTPLHKAAFWGRAEMVEVLLKSGANRYLRNEENLMAMDVAHRSPNPNAQAVVNMFKMHGTP